LKKEKNEDYFGRRLFLLLLAPGFSGEIRNRSDGVFAGVLFNEFRTAEARVGEFAVGEAATRDEDGVDPIGVDLEFAAIPSGELVVGEVVVEFGDGADVNLFAKFGFEEGFDSAKEEFDVPRSVDDDEAASAEGEFVLEAFAEFADVPRKLASDEAFEVPKGSSL